MNEFCAISRNLERNVFISERLWWYFEEYTDFVGKRTGFLFLFGNLES